MNAITRPVFVRGTGEYGYDVVGESNYQQALEAICGGRTEVSANELVEAVLLCEDSNPYERQAVRVDVQGRTVGYLSRPDAWDFRRFLAESGCPGHPAVCAAVIRGGWYRDAADFGHYGVKLDLPPLRRDRSELVIAVTDTGPFDFDSASSIRRRRRRPRILRWLVIAAVLAAEVAGLCCLLPALLKK